MDTAKNNITQPIEVEEKFTKPFHYEDKDDELLGIETAIYQNGNMVKRFQLSSGQTVIARELFGSDSVQIDKMILAEKGNREEMYMNALFHHAVKIDGKQLPIEDYPKIKLKDYNKIKSAVQSLNF